MKYLLGDTVVAIGPAMWGDVQPGELGTVVARRGPSIGVCWGRFVSGGHECGLVDRVPKNSCTWVNTIQISLYFDKDDVVLSDIVSIESMI